MQQARQISLYITLTLWATLIGGVMYSHIVYFPPYLSHLPESTNLINGAYAIHDGNFWMLMHPTLILSLIVTLILNWKVVERRRWVLATVGIYALTIVATALYFVPELMAFADSYKSNTTTVAEWFERGQTWQHLSWVRGCFMYSGFVFLLFSLTKDKTEVRFPFF